MSTWIKRNTEFFLRRYCTVDVRALALMRFVLGVCCFLDVLRRIPYIPLLYSNSGIWSNHFATFSSPNPPFSLLYALSTNAEVTVFFLFGAVVSLSFAMGYKTFISNVLLLVVEVSIINRNLLVIYGGDTMIIITLTYALFLPMGATWSADGIWNQKDKIKEFTSSIVFMCFIQLSVIYFLAGIQKNGATWIDGDALYYMLQQERIVTTLGILVRENIPASLLRLGCHFSQFAEITCFIFILTPFFTSLGRRIAFWVMFTFHFAIFFLVKLGLFSIVMFSFLTILLSKAELDFVSRKIDPLLQSVSGKENPRDLSGHVWWLNMLRGVGICSLIIIFYYDLLCGNQFFSFIPDRMRPVWVQNFVDYTSWRQSWSMFAPDAPLSDHHIILDAVFEDNSHTDLLTGQDPVFQKTTHTDRNWNQLTDALTRLPSDIELYETELSRWIRERRGGMLIPANKSRLSMESVTLYDVASVTPSPEEVSSDDVTITLIKKFILSDS